MYNADRRVCRRENFEKRNKAAMRKVLPDQGNYAGTEMTKMAIMAQPIRAGDRVVIVHGPDAKRHRGKV